MDDYGDYGAPAFKKLRKAFAGDDLESGDSKVVFNFGSGCIFNFGFDGNRNGKQMYPQKKIH